ncbi:MAG: FAD binding domain-containing protein [Actinomycetota bacterium]|nr:FAD binding domain-containing protein [Actinomycetota bacterium]
MKPGPFRYIAAQSVEEALDVLASAEEDVAILAGGQSLVSLMNLRLARPDIVLDINRVPGLATVQADDSGARIGALARAAVVERDASVGRYVPALITAIGHIGHPQVRNRTTIGGNVAHADPSSELPGLLACMEGTVTLASASRGAREVGWDEFFISVFTTCKEPDELVTSVNFPMAPGWRYAYDEVATRHGDYPLAGVSMGLRVDGGVVQEARVSVVGVADRPVRLSSVEAAAAGQDASAALARDMAGIARTECPASDDAHVSAEHRRWLAGTLVSRLMASMVDAA